MQHTPDSVFWSASAIQPHRQHRSYLAETLPVCLAPLAPCSRHTRRQRQASPCTAPSRMLFPLPCFPLGHSLNPLPNLPTPPPIPLQPPTPEPAAKIRSVLALTLNTRAPLPVLLLPGWEHTRCQPHASHSTDPRQRKSGKQRKPASKRAGTRA
eukprot:2755293-Rhodomonas_salina.3